jgi:hypothetical protein
MAFLKENIGTIVTAAVVFGVIGMIIARLVINARAGRTSCSCGSCGGPRCDKCG